MTNIDLIKLMNDFARKFDKRLFSLREIATYSGESQASIGMTLVRARRTGLVGRVRNLWFNKMDMPSIADIALTLRSPSYISFESALYHHGILSQAPKDILTVATTLRPCIVETALGKIYYGHLSQRLFFGFDADRIAYPEKAMLDLIYIRNKRGLGEFSEVIYTDMLDKKRLAKFAKNFPPHIQRRLCGGNGR